MVGVTRVFVAKHDIFMSDVTNCFTNLKKAVLELKKVGLVADSLELTTSSVRPDTITLSSTARDGNAFDFEFNLFEPFWSDVTGSESIGTLSLSGGTPSSWDNASEEGIIFEPPTPGIHRQAQSSAAKKNSPTRNNQDQYILNEAHLYDPTSDPLFGGMNSGQNDGLNWNDFLLPDDANGLGIGDAWILVWGQMPSEMLV
ncbi:hypothetical protein BS47DRAFT_23112 [Hydnum rufescens UP504]|uniref:Uncharacterized protein n=1 Tax=Hydnum rufescens UP504 TaxID=1448309 RepID=A0A9P6E1H8_9AGAM|nr:hypothetical protein BS47DRAFT_23112 [Hydnum rufescens UP504]